MSVLIKGLKMPKEGCKDCLLVKRGRVYDICPFLKREVNGNVERGGKSYDCPLIELPDHGDLIDREVALYKANRAITIQDAIDAILDAPTVIPAERSNNGET